MLFSTSLATIQQSATILWWKKEILRILILIGRHSYVLYHKAFRELCASLFQVIIAYVASEYWFLCNQYLLFGCYVLSQWIFPKCELTKGISPSANFLTVQLPKRQLPKSVLAAALGPSIISPQRSAPSPSCRSAQPPLQPPAP